MQNAAAISRSAHLEHGVFLKSFVNRCKLCSSLVFLTWECGSSQCDQAGDLGVPEEKQHDADVASSPQVCQWLTSNPESRTNSALFVKPRVAPSGANSGTCWDHFSSLQHRRLLSWSVCSDFPNLQCLSGTFPLSMDAVGFGDHKTRSRLVLLSLFASHSSSQVSYNYVHPLLQSAVCEQCVPALLLIPSYQSNKCKAGPYELWGVTGPCSCRSPSNQVTSFTLIMIISHFSRTPCCQTPVLMSLSVHQCTPNSIKKVGIVFCKANEDTDD